MLEESTLARWVECVTTDVAERDTLGTGFAGVQLGTKIHTRSACHIILLCVDGGSRNVGVVQKAAFLVR